MSKKDRQTDLKKLLERLRRIRPETGWTSFKNGKGEWIRNEEAFEGIRRAARVSSPQFSTSQSRARKRR